ncbi:hypothetical protein HYC85_021742 [Camellia sinensis]|uniref:Nucleotide-diphospho-sugar transferase domain-containing protein n=1 Tax=Camellia sinensis TaxID=4442 RepID=A0A7J7GK11_CAMSI|nr:hypothetical protein HYC85_021742 [Camellia sinensis]
MITKLLRSIRDADVLWFRDPFLHFYLDGDFQISCDFFRSNPSDINNQPNGGFNYVKSNKHTIKFYQFWYTSRETYPGLHDQDVLDKIKFDPLFSIIGVKMRFLDTAYFGGFCQPSKDLNHVCTMHANCCIGLDHKVHDLKVMLEDWRKFLSLPTNVKALQSTSWTIPQKCSFGSISIVRRKTCCDYNFELKIESFRDSAPSPSAPPSESEPEPEPELPPLPSSEPSLASLPPSEPEPVPSSPPSDDSD